MIDPQPADHFHFVTGRLAESAVREIALSLQDKYQFEFSIGVMPITVAALMTPRWLRRHLKVPREATYVIVPGYCRTDDDSIDDDVSVPVIYGPKDCRLLPELFGNQVDPPKLDEHSIEIIAEINHAPRKSVPQCVAIAKRMIADGADRIDVGCDPATPSINIGDYVSAIIDLGVAVSIDSFDADEVIRATSAGASLVLSVNQSNVHAAVDYGCEVVAIPDFPTDKKSLKKTVEFLRQQSIAFRIDPILEPIGSGLAASLVRYAEVREQYPDDAMMMGIGNLTELTDVDSAGINLMLLGICQELKIESVLTTEVINWSRSSVRECDMARRMVHHSVARGVPPKRLSDQLVMLRDPKLRPFPDSMLEDLPKSLKDNNYRLFAQNGELHLISAGLHLSGKDPFELFDQLMELSQSDNVDAGHAFYLGYEMSKAVTALQLGKQYDQDQSLNWGHLTVPEDMHRIKRTSRHRKKSD